MKDRKNRKKRMICLSLLLTMLCLLAGCAGESEAVTQEKLQEGGEQETAEEQKESTSALQQEDAEQEPAKDTAAETYTWKEMTVSIPTSWKDKYEVEESENGFYFYQTASSRVQDGLGYLCGFSRSEKIEDESIGLTMVAYTDSVMYSFQVPTDVNCDYDNEATRKEYMEMMQDVEAMKKSLSIDEGDVHYDAQEYVFPKSDMWEIPEELLMNADSNALWIARNEIFARYGREFSNSYLQSYFNSCSWYTASTGIEEFDEAALNETEKTNLDHIKMYEAKLEAENPYPVRYAVGKDFEEDLNGDGQKERIHFEFRPSDTEEDHTALLTIDGKEYNLNQDFDAYFMNPKTEEIYVTDILPSVPGLEIAVMDYGPSDDETTAFYTYDDTVHALGQVGGFPFKDSLGINGLADEGGVYGVLRADIINTIYTYGYWWYNQDEAALEAMNPGMMPVRLDVDGEHELFVDLQVHTSPSEESSLLTMKKQKQVYFMETDGKEWIRVKGKDGTQGYMKCSSDSIEGTDLKPEQVFSNLQQYD